MKRYFLFLLGFCFVSLFFLTSFAVNSNSSLTYISDDTQIDIAIFGNISHTILKIPDSLITVTQKSSKTKIENRYIAGTNIQNNSLSIIYKVTSNKPISIMSGSLIQTGNIIFDYNDLQNISFGTVSIKVNSEFSADVIVNIKKSLLPGENIVLDPLIYNTSTNGFLRSFTGSGNNFIMYGYNSSAYFYSDKFTDNGFINASLLQNYSGNADVGVIEGIIGYGFNSVFFGNSSDITVGNFTAGNITSPQKIGIGSEGGVNIAYTDVEFWNDTAYLFYANGSGSNIRYTYFHRNGTWLSFTDLPNNYSVGGGVGNMRFPSATNYKNQTLFVFTSNNENRMWAYNTSNGTWQNALEITNRLNLLGADSSFHLITSVKNATDDIFLFYLDRTDQANQYFVNSLVLKNGGTYVYFQNLTPRIDNEILFDSSEYRTAGGFLGENNTMEIFVLGRSSGANIDQTKNLSIVMFRQNGDTWLNSSGEILYTERVEDSVAGSLQVSRNSTHRIFMLNYVENQTGIRRIKYIESALNIDVTPPNISFVAPTDTNNTITSRQYTYVNVSVSDISQTSSFIDFNRSLMLYLNMNNNTKDSSTYGNNGTSSGNIDCSSGISGKFGTSCSFDLNGGQVSLGTNIFGTSVIKNMTLSAWVKTSYNGFHQAILSEYNSGVCGDSLFYVASPSGVLGFNDGGTSILGTKVINDGLWHHVAYTVDGINGSIYVDGSLDTTGAAIFWGGGGQACSLDVKIGRTVDTNYYFNGSIDELLVFNRNLSAQEIGSLYNNSQYKLFKNFTGLAKGNYEYYALATDVFGNTATTETRFFTVNITNLMLNISLNKTGIVPSYIRGEDVNVSGVFKWDNNTLIQGHGSNVTIRWLNSANNTVRQINFTPTNSTTYPYGGILIANDASFKETGLNRFVRDKNGTYWIIYKNSTDGNIYVTNSSDLINWNIRNITNLIGLPSDSFLHPFLNILTDNTLIIGYEHYEDAGTTFRLKINYINISTGALSKPAYCTGDRLSDADDSVGRQFSSVVDSFDNVSIAYRTSFSNYKLGFTVYNKTKHSCDDMGVIGYDTSPGFSSIRTDVDEKDTIYILTQTTGTGVSVNLSLINISTIGGNRHVEKKRDLVVMGSSCSSVCAPALFVVNSTFIIGAVLNGSGTTYYFNITNDIFSGLNNISHGVSEPVYITQNPNQTRIYYKKTDAKIYYRDFSYSKGNFSETEGNFSETDQQVNYFYIQTGRYSNPYTNDIFIQQAGPNRLFYANVSVQIPNYWDNLTLNKTADGGIWWVVTEGHTIENGTARTIYNVTPFNVTLSRVSIQGVQIILSTMGNSSENYKLVANFSDIDLNVNRFSLPNHNFTTDIFTNTTIILNFTGFQFPMNVLLTINDTDNLNDTYQINLSVINTGYFQNGTANLTNQSLGYNTTITNAASRLINITISHANPPNAVIIQGGNISRNIQNLIGSLLNASYWWGDWLNETQENWRQNLSVVTYVNGTAYIQAAISGNNIANATFSNIDFSCANKTSWTATRYAGVISSILNLTAWNETGACSSQKNNVITSIHALSKGVMARVGDSIKYRIKSNWTNTDTDIGFMNVTENFTVQTSGSNIVCEGNGSQLTGDFCVRVGTVVSLKYNTTLSANETLDPAVNYTDGLLKKTESSNFQGTAIINLPVPFTRSIVAESNTTENLTNIYINTSLPSCFANISVNITNSTGSQINHSFNGSIVNWTIASLNSGEIKSFFAKFNISGPNVTRNTTQDIDFIWTRFFDVNGTCLSLSGIESNAQGNESIATHSLFHNSSGSSIDITTNEDYNVLILDKNNNGKTDTLEWTIPSIAANSNASFFIQGPSGVPGTCTLKKREILTKPVLEGQNVKFNETIQCTNQNDIMININEKYRVPLDGFNFKLDGNATPRLIDKFGTYIELSQVLDIQTNKTRQLEYFVPPVATFCTFLFQTEFFVDQLSPVNVSCTVKNFAGQDINETIQKAIPITFGENVVVKDETGTTTDKKSSVTGQYILNIPKLKADESKTFNITFDIRTATSAFQKLADTAEGFKRDKMTIESISLYTLENVFVDIEKISCSNFQYAIDLQTESQFTINSTDTIFCVKNRLNPEGKRIIRFDIGALDIGQTKDFIVVWFEEEKLPVGSPSLILLVVLVVSILIGIVYIFRKLPGKKQ